MVPCSHYNINHLCLNKLLLTICFQLLSFIYLSTKCYLHGIGLQRQSLPKPELLWQRTPKVISTASTRAIGNARNTVSSFFLTNAAGNLSKYNNSSLLKFYHPHKHIPTPTHPPSHTHTHTHKCMHAQSHQRKYGHGIKISESDARECTRVTSL